MGPLEIYGFHVAGCFLLFIAYYVYSGVKFSKSKKGKHSIFITDEQEIN